EIENFNGRKRALRNALCERQQFIFAAARVMKRFERWRCRSEQGECILELGAYDRDVTPVIARCFFLLVAGFLFLIDDYQAELFNGSKNGGARSDNDTRFTVPNSPPFMRALNITERGMQHGHAFEARAEPGAALPPN